MVLEHHSDKLFFTNDGCVRIYCLYGGQYRFDERRSTIAYSLEAMRFVDGNECSVIGVLTFQHYLFAGCQAAVQFLLIRMSVVMVVIPSCLLNAECCDGAQTV